MYKCYRHAVTSYYGTITPLHALSGLSNLAPLRKDVVSAVLGGSDSGLVWQVSSLYDITKGCLVHFGGCGRRTCCKPLLQIVRTTPLRLFAYLAKHAKRRSLVFSCSKIPSKWWHRYDHVRCCTGACGKMISD